LIIKVPGKEPGACHSFAELIDLYPTVAELAGLDYSPHLQGKSLVPTLDDPSAQVRDVAFSVSRYGVVEFFLLRTEKWAYIQYGEDGKAGKALFDMELDPKQYNNLAVNPKFQHIMDEFEEKLREKLREVRDNDLGIDY